MAPTPDQIARHLTVTFERACKAHRDLMEPYVTRLGDTDDHAEQIEIMRAGLRETIAQRFPMPTY